MTTNIYFSPQCSPLNQSLYLKNLRQTWYKQIHTFWIRKLLSWGLEYHFSYSKFFTAWSIVNFNKPSYRGAFLIEIWQSSQRFSVINIFPILTRFIKRRRKIRTSLYSVNCFRIAILRDSGFGNMQIPRRFIGKRSCCNRKKDSARIFAMFFGNVIRFYSTTRTNNIWILTMWKYWKSCVENPATDWPDARRKRKFNRSRKTLWQTLNVRVSGKLLEELLTSRTSA